MATPDLVMYEEEYQQIKDTLQRLQVDSNAKIVFLVDKNGQQIAVHGDMRGVDATSLASLTAGNVAATEYSPAKRCSVDREPVPKSTSRWKPSASTRYDEQGESGPGKLPAQPRTVNLIRPLRSAAAPPR